MASLKIVELGEPVLRQKCRRVSVINKKVKKLLTDMKEAMYEANGVGLAAPQVGVSKRVVVFMAGANTTGALVAIIVAVKRLPAVPPATKPIVLAVAGATNTRSAPWARLICSTVHLSVILNISICTGCCDIVCIVKGVINSAAAAVMITWTR
jgi:hypothetical protein